MQNKRLTTYVRAMRRQPTKAEGLLFGRLRGNRCGLRIRRQHPIGPFIADFACVKKKLVIELDGWSHDERWVYDEARTEYFVQQGWRVVRYANLDVLRNVDDVLNDIERALHLPAPTQPPPRTGEGQEGLRKFHP